MQIDQLLTAVSTQLEAYHDEVLAEIATASKQTAQDCVMQIKQASPVRTRSYKNGWRSKNTARTATSIVYTVYNKTDYRLTHLLEYGHAKRGGGRTKAYPHIVPAGMRASQILLGKTKKAVKR